MTEKREVLEDESEWRDCPFGLEARFGISKKEEQMPAGWGIGHTLRERREQLGMSLGDLGTKAGVHLTIISKVEIGERRATAELLLKLAPALTFSRFELLSLAGYLDKEKALD